MDKPIYLFSDAHLGAGPPEREREKEAHLLAFLDQVAREAGEVWILGDLFDYWFEYPSLVPRRHFPVVARLWEMARSGIAIHYFLGNHDYWTRGFFHEVLGATVHPEPVVVELQGHRAYLAHGDGFDPLDRGYRVLRKVLRNRLNIALFSLLHPELGSRLAHWTSRLSRDRLSVYSEEGARRQREAACRKWAQERVDWVIMGHSHAPEIYREGPRAYLNLGDWLQHCTYGVVDRGEIRLERWKG